MSVISADIFRLSAVKMTGTPPVVPATPAMVVARITGESLNFQPSTTQSNELDPSGQLRDSILTGATTTGSVDMELTKHPFFENWLQSVFRNLWATGLQGDGTAPYTPVAVGANELIVGSLLDLYYIEKRFTSSDAVPLNYYHRVSLSAIDSLSISVAPNAPITASFGVSAGPLALSETALVGATFADPGTNPVFTAPEVVGIEIGAVPMTLCFSSLNLNFNSNVRGIECIGTLGFREQALGRFEATLEGSAYFVSNDLLQDLIDQSVFPVTVTLADSLGNQYEFFYPRCKMTAGSANASGTGQDVVANVSIQALYDPLWNFTARVTRVLAP